MKKIDVNEKIADVSLEIVKIYREFYGNKDTGMTIINAIKRICDLFNINISTIAIRNDIEQEFIKIFDYKLGEEIDIFSNALSITSRYNNIHITDDTAIIDDAEHKFIELFNNGVSYYTDTINDEIVSIFKNVNYDIDEENVTEILAHHTKVEDYFAYAVFEKQKGNPPFTEYQKDVLINLCDMIQSLLEKTEFAKLLYNERKIKDAIVKNENMPICMIEKESYKVIYFNELYKQILPNIKLNEVFSELTDKKNKDIYSTVSNEHLDGDINEDDKYWIKKSVPFKLSNGMDVYLMYAKDIEDYVEQLGVMDLLTKSLSEKGLTEYYNREIKPNNKDYVVTTIDVDKFKYINNKLGFDVGDKILKQIAITIRETMEDEEMFCRINEDKFAIIFKFNSIEEVNKKFKALKNNVLEMQIKYFPNIKLMLMGGVVVIDKAIDFNILVDQSNTARKSVKGSHESNFALYTAEVEKKVQKELFIEQRMAIAVTNNEFTPYLQPKFNLNTMEICGAEALVRWITPEGMIFPDEFIPLFEKNGFIRELDFIIYDKVMAYIRDCLNRKLPVYPISLNVSRSHIQDDEFTNKIMNLVNKHNVPIDLLELEVTESVFVEDKAVLKEFIDKIKSENFKVSIDDFGTAYSSLHVLTDINVDVLKIDKSFLQDLEYTKGQTKAGKDEIVIKNIIHMAKELEFSVICEGVETAEQIEILKNIGCKFGQGYVFARPMAIHDYEKEYLQIK